MGRERIEEGRIDVFNPAGEYLTEISELTSPRKVAASGRGWGR